MDQHTTPPAVAVSQLRRSLPLGGESVAILNGVTFAIARGEWVALTGPSGSGKSTLLGLIAGLDTPSGGTVAIDGVDITAMGEGELAQIRNASIGIVFQSFNLIPGLTAQENVEAPLYVSANRRDIGRRAAAMLELVGLGDRRGHRPHQLSGGQQQRVAIARAMVTEPALLIADEPTGNLDSAASQQILELFAGLRARLGVTIVMVTHDPDVAARADRSLHLVDGKIVLDERLGAPPGLERVAGAGAWRGLR